MDRLHSLESLVKELREQLEQANAVAAGQPSFSPENLSSGNPIELSVNEATSPNQGDSMSGGASSAGLQKQFGRLVLQEKQQNYFVGTGFWSRISDEVNRVEATTSLPTLGSSTANSSHSLRA